MATYSEAILRAGQAALPWEKLEGCNILVTGATGLIGGCLVEILMGRRHTYHVYAAGRNEQRARRRFAAFADEETFHFFKYDVSEPLQSEIPFHYVVHAASNASPVFFKNNPVEVIKANVYGVSNLMEYGLSHGMRRMLYVSTGEIYGENKRVFCETDSGYVDCAKVRSCYPSSKRAAETLCVSYSEEYGADVVIARPCHTYGPHFTESDNRVFCQFIRNVLRGEDIVMKSDGLQMRSWCYVVDCAVGLLYILLKGESGNAYNVADPTSTFTIRELAATIAESNGKKVVFENPTDSESKSFTAISHAVFSTEKLESLGWKLNGDWREKLVATVDEEKREYL